MALDPRRVKALFQAALDQTNPVERADFLDRECGTDADLRRRLDDLLAAEGQAISALDRPVVAEATLAADFVLGATVDVPSGPTVGEDEPRAAEPRAADLASPVGTIIANRYKVRQEIGEGGMGSVYLAEQFQPVKRLVALKLIKAGMDSRTVLARFDSERQALAIMDHPNIARVLDAGSTDRGHPFFVMELVRGIPLTDYCDQHRLGLPEPAGTLPADLRGGAACPSKRDHPPRPQTDEYPGRRPRRPPRPQGDRLRPGQGDLRNGPDRAKPVHGVRLDHRDAPVHGPRAGDVQRHRHRHPR